MRCLEIDVHERALHLAHLLDGILKTLADVVRLSQGHLLWEDDVHLDGRKLGPKV